MSSDSLKEGLKKLEAAALKKTKGREALLRALIQHHGPYSVDELHSIVKGQKLDLATVYRCLTAFEKIGIVRRCDFGDGIARYEIQMDSSHHHHHVTCRKCRKSENIDDCEVQQLEHAIQKKGYSEITHNLEFFGLCRKCTLL